MPADTPETKSSKLAGLEKNIDLCEDFYLGAVSIGDNYFPEFEAEKPKTKELRLASTLINNLYAPIVNGLVGVITQKEPKFENNSGDIPFFSATNVDNRGTNFFSFVKEVLTRAMVQGACFIVPISTGDNDVKLKYYSLRELHSYQSNSEGEVTKYVFKDTIEVPKGRFDVEKRYRYIVYKPFGGEVWVADNDGGASTMTDFWENDIPTPTVARLKLGYEKTINEIFPRLFDIARMNQTLLCLETMLANVLNVVSNPLPVAFGDFGGGDEDGINVGLKEVLTFENKQEQGLEYVEINGNSIGAIERKIQEVRQEIEKSSFSLLSREQAKTVVEAVDSQSKSQGFIVDAAFRLENTFNRLFDFVIQLTESNVPLYADSKEPNIVFNTDYENMVFSIDQLTIFSTMVQTGQISLTTFWKKLEGWSILPVGFDPAQEIKDIAATAAIVQSFMTQPGGDSENDDESDDNDNEGEK